MIGAAITKEVRKAVYRREGYQCAVCGSNRQLEVHHIIKRSQGGTNDMQNLVCLCHWCHCAVHGERVMPECLNNHLGPMRREDVELEIIQYMADYYAESFGVAWWPWTKAKGPTAKERDNKRHSKWPEVFFFERWEQDGWF